MKKFKILLSLIATTVLLTSCNEATSITDLYSDDYGDKYSDDWLSSNTE